MNRSNSRNKSAGRRVAVDWRVQSNCATRRPAAFREIPVGTRYCSVKAKKRGATGSASAYRESTDTRHWQSQWHLILKSNVDKVSGFFREAFANFDEDLPQPVLAGAVTAISPIRIILCMFNEHRVSRRPQ